MLHFHNAFLNLFNILSFFSDGIIISSSGSCLTILSSFGLVTAYVISFSKNSPAVWTTFLRAVFKESSPASINRFHIFSQIIKIHIL